MHLEPLHSAPESEKSATNSHETFLSTMEHVLPWTKLRSLTGPCQPGVPSSELEGMLRIYLVQAWFGLSDPGAEAALHDSLSIRRFVGGDQRQMSMPCARIIGDFRERMDRSAARHEVNALVGHYLLANRYFLRKGSRIDPVLGRYDEHTGYLRRLAEHFQSMSSPYELRDIKRFNAIYREIFAHLNAAERQRAEHLVERLIEGVASPDYVPMIFGVV